MAGTGLQFEDPSSRVMKVAQVSSQASSKVIGAVAGSSLFSHGTGRGKLGGGGGWESEELAKGWSQVRKGAVCQTHHIPKGSAMFCLNPPVSCSIGRPSQVWRESTTQLREAADLFRRAADSGHGDASYQLGRLYQQGLGLPLDPVAAFDNFVDAADGEVFHPAAGERGY